MRGERRRKGTEKDNGTDLGISVYIPNLFYFSFFLLHERSVRWKYMVNVKRYGYDA